MPEPHDVTLYLPPLPECRELATRAVSTDDLALNYRVYVCKDHADLAQKGWPHGCHIGIVRPDRWMCGTFVGRTPNYPDPSAPQPTRKANR